MLKENLEIYDIVGSGRFSNVFICDYNNDFYAYKEYIDKETIKKIKDKMLMMHEYKSDEQILFPIEFVYSNNRKKVFDGIISKFYYDYYDLNNYNNMYTCEKVLMLKTIRNLIEYLHKQYNIIHSDLNPGNILYNSEENDAKIIDLDLSIDMKQKTGYDKTISNTFTNKYIKYFGIDTGIDIYMFNLLTISLLNNWDFYNIEKLLNKKHNILFGDNRIENIINSYKNIESQKKLKKEYIIDYI